MEDNRQDVLGNCPTEVATWILSFLNLNDLLTCQTVCKRWYDLVDSNVLWKPFWDTSLPVKDFNLRKDFNWLYRRPCDYKLRYLNHKRVMKNWSEDRYRKYVVDGRWVEATAYDGRTLVVNNGVSVDVYRVDRGSIRRLQSLRYKSHEAHSSVTNTLYIVTKYKPFLLVYQLTKSQKYKISYMLQWESDGGLSLKMVRNPKEMRLHEKATECTYPFWSYWMCLLNNTLFIYVSHIQVMFAWDLETTTTLLRMKSRIQSFHKDGERVYVVTSESLSAYDDRARHLYTVKSDRRIDKTMLNAHMILGMSWESRSEEGGGVIGWEKCTGQEIIRTSLPSVTNDTLLHPTKNVLFDIDNCYGSEQKEVYAVELHGGSRLWSTAIGESSLLGDLHSIVANRFLLFSTYSGYIFDILDTTDGHYLYSLYGIDDYSVFTAYDILAYVDQKQFRLVIHLYS